MIDVLTAITNNFDNLRPPPEETSRMRFLCYTDQPLFDTGWQLQPIERGDCPSRTSRIPKILSHLHVAPGCKVSAWMDGCFRPKIGADRWIIDMLNGCDIAVFRHPRGNAFAEAEYCNRDASTLGFSSDVVGDIHQQVSRYRDFGYPGTPFVCGGVILRRENPAVRAFNELWWSEFIKGGRRDQFSLSYALWKSHIRVNVIESDILTENPGFGFHFHGADAFAHLSDNPRFRERREFSAARQAELKRLVANGLMRHGA